MTFTWRTNIGLRLTAKEGEWFEKKTIKDNRAYSNYIRYLIMQEIEKEEKGVDTSAHT